MSKLFKINDKDNVAVALEELKKGEIIDNIKLLDDIPFWHKVLLNDLKNGENIIKYGNPIGHLTIDCKKGEHIHEHNLKTNLSDIIEYKYCGENEYQPKKCDVTFNGYLRQYGRAATRNEIWIIPTVGCVNNTAKRLEKIGQEIIGDGCDGLFVYTHPFDCSQLGASVPTIKISSNSRLAKRKSNWIDFNAGELIESNDFENMTEEIFKLLIDIASGRKTKNEQNGYRDISIFKDGVIM